MQRMSATLFSKLCRWGEVIACPVVHHLIWGDVGAPPNLIWCAPRFFPQNESGPNGYSTIRRVACTGTPSKLCCNCDSASTKSAMTQEEKLSHHCHGCMPSLQIRCLCSSRQPRHLRIACPTHGNCDKDREHLQFVYRVLRDLEEFRHDIRRDCMSCWNRIGSTPEDRWSSYRWSLPACQGSTPRQWKRSKCGSTNSQHKQVGHTAPELKVCTWWSHQVSSSHCLRCKTCLGFWWQHLPPFQT